MSYAALNYLSEILPRFLIVMLAGPLQLQSQVAIILIADATDSGRWDSYAQYQSINDERGFGGGCRRSPTTEKTVFVDVTD